ADRRRGDHRDDGEGQRGEGPRHETDRHGRHSARSAGAGARQVSPPGSPHPRPFCRHPGLPRVHQRRQNAASYAAPMAVEVLTNDDRVAAAELWAAVELTRPWNDPLVDFDRAIEGPTSTVLGLRDDGNIVGTVMVGHDGHRGWIYYLAVSPDRQ